MVHRPAVLSLIAGTLVLTRALPAQSVGESLALEQAVALAIEHHPSIRGAQANVSFAHGGLTQAKSNYFPTITALGSAQYTSGAFVSNPTFPIRNQEYKTYSAGLQGNLTLFDFGKTINRVSAGSSLVDASSLDYEASRAAVIMNVEIAYFGVVQAAGVVHANEEAVDQATRHLVQANAFYKAGTRPLFDVTKAEVDLANANVSLIQAKNGLRVANLQLENAIGVHPAIPYRLTDTLSVREFLMTLDSVKQTAFTQRPELLAARARVEANRSLASAAWDQHLPTLSAFGTWTWSNFDLPLYSRWNAGVSLSLPLFQGFSIAGQVQQAEASADAAQAALDVLKESIVLEVEQAFYGLKEAEERLAATSKLVEQAQQNLLLAERQYAAGVGTPIETTDAQVSLSNARITRIQALYDYNSSLVRLQKAMGVLGR